MTTLKHLVRGATRSGKSPGWAISDPQPTEMDSLGRLAAPIIADVAIKYFRFSSECASGPQTPQRGDD